MHLGQKVAIVIVYVWWMVMGALGQEERLSEVIREAAFDPTKWRDVCDGFAHLMGGVGSVILPTALASPAPIAAHSEALDESLQVYFKDEWYRRDVRRNSLPLTLPRGWATDADCIAYDDLGRSEFYGSFLPSCGLKWFAGVAFGRNKTECMISIQRQAKAGLSAKPTLPACCRFAIC